MTDMSREQMEAAGYGVHHISNDGKYLIMGNGTRAFAVAAEGLKNVCLLSMDSEGTDGTTPVAGGLTDGTTGTAAAERGIDLRKALREHAAYEALEPLGDTVLTGNTGTNLCDFNVLYIGTQE